MILKRVRITRPTLSNVLIATNVEEKNKYLTIKYEYYNIIYFA
jgi:hypothetical protein